MVISAPESSLPSSDAATHCISCQPVTTKEDPKLEDERSIESSCHPMLKFPVENTDLVVLSGSPDFTRRTSASKEDDSEKDLSLEKEKDGLLRKDCLDVSFELPTVQAEKGCDFLSVNCGELDANTSVVSDKFHFQKDSFFVGGDVVKTDEKIGGSALYQTARYGDFCYKFNNLEQGDYLIDLHLAEIVLTEGPSGIRTFDVIIQDEKVVSGLDIYDLVYGNQPLVLSDLNATVTKDGSLAIKF